MVRASQESMDLRTDDFCTVERGYEQRRVRVLLARFVVLFFVAFFTWCAVCSVISGSPASGLGSMLASGLAAIGSLAASLLDARLAARERRRLALTTVQRFPAIPATLLLSGPIAG
jgi:hypothetical protein